MYQRLRTEIIDRVGLERAPTYEDLKSMKYLQVSSISLILEEGGGVCVN